MTATTRLVSVGSLLLASTICFGYGAMMNVADITSTFSLISKGRIFFIEAKPDQEHFGPITRDIYQKSGEVFAPAGDISLVGRVFTLEGFRWSHDKQVQQELASTIVRLYNGSLGSTVLTERYFMLRSVPDSVDLPVIERLRREFGTPVVKEQDGTWEMQVYAITERVGPLLVFRYTVDGEQTPFTIRCVKCERITPNPAIVFTEPIPR